MLIRPGARTIVLIRRLVDQLAATNRVACGWTRKPAILSPAVQHSLSTYTHNMSDHLKNIEARPLDR